MGENDFGVLAAHGQQLVHREGGGAEDGLEGDGVDALSPQLLFQLFHKLVVPLSGCYSMVPSKPSRMSSSFAAL